MDSPNMFRKLTVGAKFDLKRFRTDAETVMMVKRTGDDGQDDESNDDGNGLCQRPDKPAKRKKKMTKEKKKQLKVEEMNRFRNEYGIRVKGTDIPDAVKTLDGMVEKYGVTDVVVKNMTDSGYRRPTPVQMQAMPLMFDRRELIVSAPTGSGKTLAYLLPIVHQLRCSEKLGFRAVIIAPTRELVTQIHREFLWIADGSGLRIHIIKNVNLGLKLFGQRSKKNHDILITTPNRLIYLLNKEAINLKDLEWLIIDECDKLFEADFRSQLSVIYKACSQSAKARRAMFSATFSDELEKWLKMNLDNVVSLVVGGKNKVTKTVTQELLFVGSEQGKLIALRDLIAKGQRPPVLIFVDKIKKAKILLNELLYDGINIDAIHSKRSPEERDNVVKAFRNGQIWFLVCTDLMGRGIDFKGVNMVINYDFPKDSISYIHRIGRTGRAGRTGQAVTFFTESDSDKLRKIAKVMKSSGCEVPPYMLAIRNKRKSKKGKRYYKADGGTKKPPADDEESCDDES